MESEGVRYLLSFLAVLVQRAGGTLVIEHLSQASNQALQLKMDLDKKGDRVTLTVESDRPGSKKIH